MAGMAEGLVRRPETPSGPGTVRGGASGMRHQPRPSGPKEIATASCLAHGACPTLVSPEASIFLAAPPRTPSRPF